MATSAPPRLLAALAAVALLLAGCGSDDDWSAPHARAAAVGTLGPGFVDPEHPPAPEGTVRPRPGSWDGVRPAKGYRVVLLRAGDDPATRTAAAAVTAWADDVHASVKRVTARAPSQFVPSIARSIALEPDLVICVGDQLVDALALVTPNHLSQPFLVVGAQVAEPTANVTAVDWVGAGYRGEGLGLPAGYDRATFTPERTARAVRAGVAAVLSRVTGVVIRIS